MNGNKSHTSRAVALMAFTSAFSLVGHAAMAQSEGASLSEIVVTAQKREESLQSVPIAISAFGEETLKKANVQNLEDINLVAPGVNFTKGLGNPVPFIRGIGSSQTSAGQEGSASVYIDGVYMPHGNGLAFSFNNIERIEVLRGPQGTLFGRNATAGLISIVTHDPTHDAQLKGSIGYGNYDRVEGALYASHGLSDTVAADIAAYYSHQAKGFGHNLLTGSEISQDQEFGVRTKWLWTPTDATRVTLGADYSRIRSSIGLNRQPAPGSFATTNGTGYTGSLLNVRSDVDPMGWFEAWGASATIRHDTGMGFDIVSISAYRNSYSKQDLDQESGATKVSESTVRDRNEAESQELQLTSNGDGPLRWIVGAYYLHNPATLAALSLRSTTNVAGGNTDGFGVQTVTSKAIFGQATYAITDRTNLTVGVRYTTDHRTFKNAYTRNIVTGAITLRNPALKSDYTFKKPTWRIALDHKFTDSLLGYVSYNRGFKAGVFSATNRDSPAVKPEILDAYETGIKSDWMDRRLRINLATYYYDYRDLQVQQVGALTGTTLVNAATAEIYGGELELEAIPADRLRLNSSLTYTHARYKDFKGVQAFTRRLVAPYGLIQFAGDASGNRLLRTPDWTATVGADYSIPVSVGEITLNVTYAYNDGFFWEAENRARQKPYSLVNAQVGWRAPESRWGVRAWAKNLTDTRYAVNLGSSTPAEVITGGPPRTYGVTFDFDL